MLHLRRRCDIHPEAGWPEDQRAVITDNGYAIGVIMQPGNWSDGSFYWAINGDVVAGVVNAAGTAGSLDEAKDALATSWRRFLEIRGLDERTYTPPFGYRLTDEQRHRLRLPV